MEIKTLSITYDHQQHEIGPHQRNGAIPRVSDQMSSCLLTLSSMAVVSLGKALLKGPATAQCLSRYPLGTQLFFSSQCGRRDLKRVIVTPYQLQTYYFRHNDSQILTLWVNL